MSTFIDRYPNAIVVWAWEDAPPQLKQYSTNGGDEDWIALVPKDYTRYIPWLDFGSGGSEIIRYDTEYGTVYISCHA